MQTIESRINGLGLAEASVQQRGGADSEAEILISLPGLDDPARVKAILQTAALLELYEVKGGPYPRQEDAYGANGGVLPLGTQAGPRPHAGRRAGRRLVPGGAHAGDHRTRPARFAPDPG
jgi:preprotein translocase subunit SecD